MARRFSILSATILVLINLGLVSSGRYTYDIDNTRWEPGMIVLTNRDLASKEQKVRHVKKAPNLLLPVDLQVGNSCSEDIVWEASLDFNNHRDTYVDFPMQVKVNAPKIIHYLSVLNDPDSPAQIIGNRITPNWSTANFIVRLPRRSQSSVSMLVAAHEH